MTQKSTSALEYFFYGEEFELWKLHTWQDYLNFFSFIFFGMIALFILYKLLKAQRTQEKAVLKVNRRLNRLARKPCKLFKKVTLSLPSGSQTFDAILMDPSGIYLVKTFGWGLKVFGTPTGEKWRLEDNTRKEEIPNPLFDLKKAIADLQTCLEEQELRGIKIQPLVVFADSYSTPELFLGSGSNSTPYQYLKSWYKKQASVKKAQYDLQRATAVIEKMIL